MGGDKFIKNSIIAGSVLGLIANGLKQWQEKENDPQYKFKLDDFILGGIKGAGVGLVASGTIVLFSSLLESEEFDEEDFDELEYLESVLYSFELDEIDKKTIKKGFKIKNKLYKAFGDKLVQKPKFQGSMAKGTALSGISDLDIWIGYEHDSHSTLEDMYCSTLQYFQEEFEDNSLIEVRQQKKSIGLVFCIEDESVVIDVVPAKAINSELNKKSYFLYDNPKGLFGRPSRVKMNPEKQADLGSYSTAKAKMVTLLKVLKENGNFPLKGMFIETLTKEAFRSHGRKIPKRVDRQLLMTLEYIRDNIEYRKIVSPDNTNNILSNSLTRNEKRQVADSLDYIICDVKENPANLKKYFPNRDDL